MRFHLKDLVDIPQLQELTDHLYRFTSIPTAILAPDGEILTQSGWRRICTDFHRKHPEIEKQCIASNVAIRETIDAGDPFVMYTCPRGLTDASVPIVIEGEHVANAFAGQLFVEPPDQTVEMHFRECAREFGLDEDAYMEAFREIPILPLERFRPALFFLAHLARMVAELGLQKKRELETNARLAQSEKRYRTLFEKTGDLVVLLDADVNGVPIITDINQTVVTAHGYAREELIGRPITILEPDVKPDEIASRTRKMLKTGRVDFEARHRRKDGSVFDAEVTAVPVKIGGKTMTLAVQRDVTERKTAEIALRESEAKNRAILDALPDMMFRLSREGVHLDFHAPAPDRLYLQPENFLGKNVSETLPADVAQRYVASAARALDIGKTQNFDYDLLFGEGDLRSYEARIAPGGENDVLVVVREVTDRKKAESALRESEEHFRLASQIASDVIYERDYTSGVATFYGDVDSIQGYPPGGYPRDQLGFFEHLHPDDTTPYLEIFAKHGTSPAVLRTHFRLRRADGSYVHWEESGRHLFNADGIPVKWLGAATDVTERKRAEDEIRESRKRYSQLFGAMDEGVAINEAMFDENGDVFDYVVLEVNPAFEIQSPYTAAETIGRRATDVYRMSREEIVRWWREGASLHQGTHEEYFHAASGRWFSISTTPVEKFRFITIFRDITEQKRALDALRQSEEKYRLLTENVSDVIWTMDLNERFTYLSPSVHRVWGYTPVEALRVPLRETLTAPSYELAVTTIMEEVARDDEPGVDPNRVRTMELEQIQKDRSTIWTEVTAKFLRDAEGSITGMIGATRDITERILAEKVIRESEDKFRRLAENVSDVIWTLDLEENFTYLTPSIQKAWGYTPEEALRLSLKDALTPTSYELAAATIMEEVVRDGEPGVDQARVSTMELEQVHKDGSRIWTEVTAKFLRDAEGSITGIIGATRDITERKWAEEALAQSEAMYRSLFDNMLNGFAFCRMVYENDRPVDFVYLSVNDAFEAQTGLKSVVGKNVTEVIPGIRETDAEIFDIYGRVAKTGRAESLEYHLAALDMWFAISVYSPAPDHFVAVFEVITERKRGEIALRESEEKFSTAFQNAPMLMTISKIEDGTYIDVNRKFLEVTGLAKAEVIGRSSTQVGWITPEHRGQLKPLLIETGSIDGENLSFMRKDGRRVDCVISCRLLEIGGEKRILTIAEDVTERKRAEDALRASEERYRMIAENTGDVIWLLDLETMKFLYVSPAVLRLRGYTAEEVMAQDVTSSLTSESLTHVQSKIPERLESFRRGERNIYFDEVAQPCKDGSVVQTETVSRYMKEEDDGRLIVLGVSRDITDRKRANEALRTSEARLKDVLFATADWVWEVDAKGFYTYSSPKSFDFFGLTPDDIVGKTPFDLMPPDEASRVSEIFSGIAAKKAPIRDLENWNILKNGELFCLLTNGVPILDESGNLTGYRGVDKDITVRKRAEILLQTRLDLSEKLANADLDTLIQRTLDSAEFLTGSTIGFFHFVDPDQTSLRLQTWSTNTLAKMCTAEGKGKHYPIGMAGVWADCFHTREPVVHNDYASLPNKKGMPDGHAAVVRELVVPMVKDDRVMAILGVGNKPVDYTELDIRTVQSLATLAMEVMGRKRAEEALREKTDELNQYFTRALDLFCIADTAGYFRRLNQQWEITLGYPVAELEGKRFLDLVHPDDLEPTLRAVADLANQEQVIDFVNRYRCRDGSYRWIEWRAYPRGGSIFAAARDVTERKQAEDALRESESLLKQAQEAAMLGHYALDVGTGIWTCSEGLVAVFGIDADHPRTVEGWLDIIHPDQRDEMAAYFRDEVLGKHLPFDKTYQIVRKRDGAAQWVHGRGQLTFGSDGATATMFGTIQNVTQNVEAEERARQLQAQLQQAMKLEAIGRLAGGVAHDFNNLLTVIGGNTDLLLTDLNEADPMRDDLDEIKKAADRAASLTAQLLAFSRKQVIDPKVIDLNELLAGSTKMLKRLIGEDVELDYLPGSDAGKVKVDPHQMEQVLINLAINARDAMPDGGRLSVETSRMDIDEEFTRTHLDARPGPYVILSVSDTGKGISPDILPHLFEPFFTTKEKGKGTGLGLSMVYGIIQQSGGFLNVYSEVGIGTTFKVYLPAATGEQAPIGKKWVNTLPTGTETILLVEDEQSVRALTRKFLERQGYIVKEFGRGEDACRWVKDEGEPFDLLLTDVVMPNMNGRQLYEALCELRPGLRVLYMSGYTEDAIAYRGVLDEGTNFIQKPFTFENLARALRDVLTTH